MGSIGRGICNSATLSVVSISVCGQTHFSNEYPNEKEKKKKEVPSPLTSYTANVFRLSHNSPDDMTNCTKFTFFASSSPPFWFPSNKWKSHLNASEKYSLLTNTPKTGLKTSAPSTTGMAFNFSTKRKSNHTTHSARSGMKPSLRGHHPVKNSHHPHDSKALWRPHTRRRQDEIKHLFLFTQSFWYGRCSFIQEAVQILALYFTPPLTANSLPWIFRFHWVCRFSPLGCGAVILMYSTCHRYLSPWRHFLLEWEMAGNSVDALLKHLCSVINHRLRECLQFVTQTHVTLNIHMVQTLLMR